MSVSTRSIRSQVQNLRNAVSRLPAGRLSKDKLPTRGLSQKDQQTLGAAYDYLAKRGTVTPQKLNTLLGNAQSNALRADRNRDGFVSAKESKNLGAISSRLAGRTTGTTRRSTGADGFDAAGTTAANATRSNGSTPGAQRINRALDRLDVEHNRRYLPTGRRGTSSRVTHCNEFAQDALRGIGVPRSNLPTGNANNMNRWLNGAGQNHGWRRVSAAEAQRLANSGHPALASWNNTSGPHGHVAVVRPGHNDGTVHVAQAGGHNYSDTTVNRAFGRHTPQYFVYDGPTN